MGVLGFQLERDQGNCKIFRLGESNYIGFCERESDPRNSGVIITCVVDDVDDWAAHLKSKGIALEKEPAYNPEFQIYHCFFRDPSGYLLEIQRFDKPLNGEVHNETWFEMV
jgi:catechol 2,3-dioxygenase-like lactoylglutathione lyase family enzyme